MEPTVEEQHVRLPAPQREGLEEPDASGDCTVQRNLAAGMSPDAPDRIAELLAALEEYRAARERLLSVLGSRMSNRDPLAEFAEHFVAALMGGRLASNLVQAYWDIELPDGVKVQVKYLVNSVDPGSKAWVNEHLVRSLPDVDWYALVIIEGFKVSGVAAFPPGLGPLCRALGKQHGEQDTTLQFGRRNWLAIRDHPDRFRSLGMRVWLPPFTEQRTPPPPAR
jgi:hypothetical protein